MTKNKYLAKIKKMALAHFEDTPAYICLFGSWARGTQRRSSDVDIAIKCDSPDSRTKIAELRELLEESTIPYRVDVVDMNFASETILTEIQKDGIAWTA
ncbi:MAG: nucleotidyltransferase domain-containing protein [Selenomonadaceae bacterium]|nr:nucleotidyltransferase domain-containing protein [Selenomonadaceae bacterium]